jgi:hypothetical protein
MTHKPRPTSRIISARKWRSLALAGTALGVTYGAAFAAGPVPQVGHLAQATVWQAQAVGEGGEGGEGGAIAQDANPNVAYLTRLYLVEGHLRAALSLYQMGLTDEAIGLSGHPEAEMMDEVRDGLAAHGIADITPAMDAFTDAMVHSASVSDVDAALATVSATITEAADLDARSRFDAIIALTRAAADEFTGSIEDGQVTELMAYFESRGFIEVARSALDALVGSSDPVVAASAQKSLTALDDTGDAFGEMSLTSPAPEGGNILAATAARIELASLKVK